MDELKEPTQKPNLLDSFRRSSYFGIVIFAIFVIAISIYVGDILFGERSLDVMLNLETQRDALINQIDTLKKENANLQKQYFELLGLEPGK